MLIDKVRADLLKATKDRDLKRVEALRLVVSALGYLYTTGKEVTEADELTSLKSEAKKRREAMEAYKNAGREEKYQQEETELKVIEEYLPAQASDEEIKKVVERLIGEMGKENKGQIIGRVMGEIGRDKTDGNTVGRIVNELIS